MHRPHLGGRLAVGVVASMMLVAGGFAVASQVASATPRAVVPHDEPHGVNFVIKSYIDTNFCIEADPATTGTPITLQVCNGAKDGQHWAFAWDADGSVVIVESNGQCLDARNFATGASTAAKKCTFSKASQRFAYSSKQRLQEIGGAKCLAVNAKGGGLVGGKPVIIQKCSTAVGQVWILGH